MPKVIFDMNERRSFIKKVAVLGALSLGGGDVLKGTVLPEKVGSLSLRKDDVILFQGDSITDSYRDRNEKVFNRAPGLGTGYAFLAASELLHSHPTMNFKIYNRAVSGNKTIQLNARWKEDCLDLKPTVLSILIGVNDFWVPLKNGERGTVAEYEDNYRRLLDQTKKEFPNIRIIIGEPFGFDGIEGSKHKNWPLGFETYQEVAFRLAVEYGATFVPYQKVFNKALKNADKVHWTRDGVHPTIAGSRLMADAWLSRVKINNKV